MSNAQYPTMQQVLPFFNLLISRLDSFLKCDSVDIPDYDYLKERDGKPREIAEAVYAARLKMTSYYDKTCRVPIYAISTGNHFYITKIARY